MSYGGGKYDAFVTRLAPQGNSLLYSTLIGGSGDDQAYALALDRQGQVVLAGGTTSPNFPQARNALTSGSIETDIFLSRLSADTSVNFVTASAASVTFDYRQGTPTAAKTITLASAGAPVTFTVAFQSAVVESSVECNHDSCNIDDFSRSGYPTRAHRPSRLHRSR